MELEEKINVMIDYNNGGEVELKSRDTNSIEWETTNNPNWNWGSFDYRIKEPKGKVTIEKWLCQNDRGAFISLKTSKIDDYLYCKQIKLIESYEVEL